MKITEQKKIVPEEKTIETESNPVFYSGIPVDAMVKEFKDISSKTTEALKKAQMRYGTPVS